MIMGKDHLILNLGDRSDDEHQTILPAELYGFIGS